MQDPRSKIQINIKLQFTNKLQIANNLFGIRSLVLFWFLDLKENRLTSEAIFFWSQRIIFGLRFFAGWVLGLLKKFQTEGFSFLDYGLQRNWLGFV